MSDPRAPKVKLGLRLFGVYLLLALVATLVAIVATIAEEESIATLASWVQAACSPLALIGTALVATAPAQARAVVPAVIGTLSALGVVAGSASVLDMGRSLNLMLALLSGLSGFVMLVAMTKAAQNLAWSYGVRQTHERLATLYVSTIVLLVAAFLLRCVTRAFPSAGLIVLLVPFFGAVISALVAVNVIQLAKRLPDYF